MLKWRGQWRRILEDGVSYSIYLKDDVVSYNGAIYVALKDTDGTINPEINHTNQIHRSWDLMGGIADLGDLIDGGIYC